MKTLHNRTARTATLATTLLGLLMLGGCASTGSTPAPTKADAVPAVMTNALTTPAPTPAAAAPAPKVSGDQGTVVFFRDKKFVGSAVSFKVRETDQELGRLSNGTYFSINVPVGAHAFDVKSEAKDILNLEVEKGETYYVQGTLGFGLLVGRPNLSPSDAATFEALKGKLKDSAAEDAEREAKKAAKSNKRKGSR